MDAIQHIPIELMRTFVKIVEHGGDAKAAGTELEISQSSISRRLNALRELLGDDEDRPWLILKGKRWLLTPRGERVQGVVADLVRRYDQVERFIADTHNARPTVSIACGQTAASGLVRNAVEQLMSQLPDVQVRLSTARSRSRIEGVAGGQFDMALVTEDEVTIRDLAGIELYVQPLHQDRFVVAANPSSKSAWAKNWDALPVRRPLKAKELAGLPLILPEPDARRRQQFDNWFKQGTGQTPSVTLEGGGWQNLLRFAQSGIGVALATESAVESVESNKQGRSSGKLALTTRMLDEQYFPAEQMRLIARKPQGADRPDLSTAAQSLFELLKSQVS